MRLPAYFLCPEKECNKTIGSVEMAAIKKSSHKNAARSRLLIKTAFAELLNEKDINKITVTDIVDRANISRGTFYAHYLDVYDLYAAIQTNMIEAIDELLEKLGTRNVILDPTEAMTRALLFLESNKDYYRLFVTSSNGQQLQNRIISRLEDNFTAELKEMVPPECLNDVMCYLSFIIGGIQTVTVHWLENRLPVSAGVVAKHLSDVYIKIRPAVIKQLDDENKKLAASQKADSDK